MRQRKMTMTRSKAPKRWSVACAARTGIMVGSLAPATGGQINPAPLLRRGDNGATRGDGGASVPGAADLRCSGRGGLAVDGGDEGRHLVPVSLHPRFEESGVGVEMADLGLGRHHPPALGVGEPQLLIGVEIDQSVAADDAEAKRFRVEVSVGQGPA